MCQTKPGPRCAAHTRPAKDAALTRKNAAEDALRQAEDTGDRAAILAARQHLDEARVAYSHALREYTSTPEGQDYQVQAIARLRGLGEDAAAEQAEKDLAQGRKDRAQHIADAAAARATAARLAAATPAEVAAIDQADAAVRDAEENLAAVRQAVADARARIEELRPQYETAQAAVAQANQAVRDTHQPTIDAAWNVAREAERLYVEAGINERYARFYTSDMVDAAREKDYLGRKDRTGAAAVGRALTIKVKTSGPDRDKCLAAKEAAKTDPAFKAANKALAQAVAARKEAVQAKQEIYAAQMDDLAEEWTEANRASMNAKYAIEDAQRGVDKARHDANVLKARVGAGMGATGPEPKNLSRIHDEIVRNPDGTTNAYVYRAPSDGFPHGRMAAAVDVSSAYGFSAANALVLEDGSTISASQHYSRGPHGMRSDSSDTKVYLAAPQDGATPLRAENHANAGFATFIDSTD